MLTFDAQYNCGVDNICAIPPGTVVGVAPWQYALTSICIMAGAPPQTA